RDREIERDLWFNTRLPAASRVFVPVAGPEDARLRADGDDFFAGPVAWWEDGLYSLQAEPPPQGKGGRRGKVFIRPSAGWLAGFNAGQLLLIRFDLQPDASIHPEHGQVEVYQQWHHDDPGAGLLELEVHAPLRRLAPGESMRAAETWTVLPYDGPETLEAQRAALLEALREVGLAPCGARAARIPKRLRRRRGRRTARPCRTDRGRARSRARGARRRDGPGSSRLLASGRLAGVRAQRRVVPARARREAVAVAALPRLQARQHVLDPALANGLDRATAERRIAGAEDHAGIEQVRVLDHALVQRGHRLVEQRQHEPVLEVAGRLVVLRHLGLLRLAVLPGVDALAVLLAALAGLGRLRQRRRDRQAEERRQLLAHAVGDVQADRVDQLDRPHRHAEPHRHLVDHRRGDALGVRGCRL